MDVSVNELVMIIVIRLDGVLDDGMCLMALEGIVVHMIVVSRGLF